MFDALLSPFTGGVVTAVVAVGRGGGGGGGVVLGGKEGCRTFVLLSSASVEYEDEDNG